MNDAAVGSQAPRRGLVDTAMFVLRWLQRRLLRRFKLAIPVVAVAATVGAIASLAIPQRVNPPLAEPIGDRSLLPAPAGDAVESVTTTGVVQPTLLVQVGSQLSGDIVEVLVDFNDTVAKGQSLARLDPESFEAAVREADAALSGRPRQRTISPPSNRAVPRQDRRGSSRACSCTGPIGPRPGGT